jgi:hypothetical protein
MPLNLRAPLAVVAALALLPSAAPATASAGGTGCPQASYSITTTQDGGTISVLFDRFIVETEARSSEARACRIRFPLDLPPGYGLGVYKIDYRGFAELAGRQTAQLSVSHLMGADKAKHFSRRINANRGGEFLFSETIGAGLMKRIGCGSQAVLDVTTSLELQANGESASAMAGMDSLDGRGKGGLVYHFDLRRCVGGGR